MKPIEALSFLIYLIVVVIGIPIFIWKVTRFQYSVNEKHLIMKWYFVGVIPIKFKVSLNSIIEAQKIPLTFSLFLQNPFHLFFYGKPSCEMVLVVRKRGFPRNLVISPSDPDNFIAALSKKIAEDDRTDG